MESTKNQRRGNQTGFHSGVFLVLSLFDGGAYSGAFVERGDCGWEVFWGGEDHGNDGADCGLWLVYIFSAAYGVCLGAPFLLMWEREMIGY